MITIEPKIYRYNTSLKWIEGHTGSLISSNKESIKVGCPPEFGGKPQYWSPEELLVASAELCIMTTFLDLCNRYHCPIVSYESRAEGFLHIIKGEFRFSRINILPVIEVSSSQDLEKSAEFMKQAARNCVVSRSLKTEVQVEPKLTMVDDQ